jgi:hypothetical protein
MNDERLPDAALEQTDADSILRHTFHGEPLDPEIARRVHDRAEKITEKIYRVHGLIDDDAFQKLLDDEET